MTCCGGFRAPGFSGAPVTGKPFFGSQLAARNPAASPLAPLPASGGLGVIDEKQEALSQFPYRHVCQGRLAMTAAMPEPATLLAVTAMAGTPLP